MGLIKTNLYHLDLVVVMRCHCIEMEYILNHLALFPIAVN